MKDRRGGRAGAPKAGASFPADEVPASAMPPASEAALDSDAALELRDHGLVTFRLDTQWLGMPVALVQEVLSRQEISRVPLAPSYVHGFLNLRGRIVTAVDLRTVLGLPGRDRDDDLMNVVVSHDGELFSLLVDEVGDVIEVADDRVEPTPKTLDARWLRCGRGVVRLQRRLLVVLDVHVILGVDGFRVA